MFKGISYLKAQQANTDPSNQQQVLFSPQCYSVQAAVDINVLLDWGFFYPLGFVATHGIEHSLQRKSHNTFKL